MRKTHLTDSFFLAFTAIQVVGVLSILFAPLLLIYIGLNIGVVFLLYLDWISIRTVKDLRGEVFWPENPEVGESIPIRFSIGMSQRSAISISRLNLVLPHLQTVTFEHSQVEMRPGAGSEEVQYSAEVLGRAEKLGEEQIRELVITAYSRFQLWFRRVHCSISEFHFRVIPKDRSLPQEIFRELALQQNLIHAGNRRLLRGNSPDQFHSVRKYQYPDPLRHIDQKKSAKYGQLMTRTYDVFYDHHLVICLDLGRSLMGHIGKSKKVDFYLSAAYNLARNALKSRDRVSFVAFSQSLHAFVPATRHLNDFTPLFHGKTALQCMEVETHYHSLPQLVRRASNQRAIVVLLTDATRASVQKALKPVLPALTRQHLFSIATLMESTYNLDSQVMSTELKSLSDYNRLLYNLWIEEELMLFRRHTSRMGGYVVSASEDHWSAVTRKLYGMMRESVYA